MSKSLRQLACIATLAVCSAAAMADKAKSASSDPMAQMMEENLKAMVPAIKAMTQVNIDAQLEVGAKPATAQQLAQFKRNLYQELLKTGFNEQQALQIVVATQLPAVSMSAK